MVPTPAELQKRMNSGASASSEDNKKGPPNVDWALKKSEEQRGTHNFYRSYYKGAHRLMIKKQRQRDVFGDLFRNFRMNLCKPVADAVVDRLVVQSFSLETKDGEEIKGPAPGPGAAPEPAPETAPQAEGQQQPAKQPSKTKITAATDKPPTPEQKERVPEGGAEPVDPLAEEPIEEDEELPETEADVAWKIWKRNRMQHRSKQLHKEAIATGDAALLIWRDIEGRAVLYPQKAHEIVIEYDDENPGVVKKAAKVWLDEQDDGRELYRVNLYYPDRIERYAAEKQSPTREPKAEDYQPFNEDKQPPIVQHPWGVVPVFPFANNADLGESGESELVDAIPIQDALNKSGFDLLVNLEFNVYPQKYMLNIQRPTNEDGDPVMLKSGPSEVWALEGGDTDKPPQVGAFPPGEMEPMISIMEFWNRSMAAVTGTPIHHFFLITGAQHTASGEAQKTADTKLSAKVDDRQISFGESYARAMALAVRMELDDPELDIELGTNWKDTRPRNEQEMWNIAGMKKAAGVSQKQILREMGYTDEQIKRMREENAQNQQTFGFGAGADMGTSNLAGEVAKETAKAAVEKEE